MPAKKNKVLKFVKLSKNAIIPEKAKPGDAGFDLYCSESTRIASMQSAAIKTGIAAEIPEGCYLQLFDRSGIALKTNMFIKAGVIDNGYRGEITPIMGNSGDYPINIDAGDKIAQAVLLPLIQVELQEIEKEEFKTDTERSDKGFGSTGNKSETGK